MQSQGKAGVGGCVDLKWKIVLMRVSPWEEKTSHVRNMG